MTIGKIASDLATVAGTFDRRGDDDSWLKLRRFGEALAEVGGGELMVKAYDEAVARHGWDVMRGVSDCWRDIKGWAA